MKRRVEYRDGTVVIFEVPAGIVYRGAVEANGRPVYLREGGVWYPFMRGERAVGASMARSLDAVPLATPDPVVVRGPARFEVSASTWCGWPVDVRLALRVAGGFTKGPGVMASELLDGRAAERVRELAQGLVGLEEVRA